MSRFKMKNQKETAIVPREYLQLGLLKQEAMMTVYAFTIINSKNKTNAHTKDSTRQTTKAPPKKQHSYLYHLQINIDKLEEGGGNGEEEEPSIHERRLRRRKSPQRKIQKKTKDL
mmetsp:Transcript_4266/g.6513  ORF Transcript_4266/g.6513 Transcript_4266/m.6513 type:complete len:115 (-) Transcript_4266:369-713(-)